MKNHDWLSHLTNIVVRTSITVRLTETWIQCCFNYHLRNGIVASHELKIRKQNLGLKEEWFEVHCRVSYNVHQDGRHVDGHENTQKSSAKDNLGISLKQCKEAKETVKV